MADPVQLITVPITTDSSGDFSSTIHPRNARLLQYRYVPAGSGALATGADLDIVGATTGFVYVDQDDIGTSAFTKAPRQPTHAADGTASLYASTGEPVEDHTWIGGEALTVTIAQGGDTNSGTLFLWVG